MFEGISPSDYLNQCGAIPVIGQVVNGAEVDTLGASFLSSTTSYRTVEAGYLVYTTRW